MITIAKKILPIFMMEIYKQRSMELISLAVLAVATGFAFIAHIFFNASFALGAFLAGFVLNKSLIGRKIVKKTIPLRDIFSVLFFISVGLLFDPKIIFNQPLLILIALFLIVVVKFLISFAIMRFFNKNIQESILLSVGLAQIGEFSFVLIALGNKMNVLSQDLYDVIICSAIICIIINTFLFRIIKK
jgi:CPA2 family monovalent cation:H+ antiporter-2